MRLLNTYNLEFATFFEGDRPPYLILSHRWGEDECSHQSFFQLKYFWFETPGFRKVVEFCRLAWTAGFHWVWVDTCCIDKTSSAELGEAINSMYRWYEQSEACCVFLDDVEMIDGMSEPVNWNGVGDCRDYSAQPNPKLSQPTIESITGSHWFTRGWTLQELLAPKKVRFFDRQWRYLGYRDDASTMSRLLSSITKIPEKYLKDCSSCVSVAEKMSWAANRKTSRLEDRAYSLLGLFGINMPLIYGEGGRAFQRLQKEIISEIDDESIFAWWSLKNDGSILASSPDDFSNSAGVYPVGTVQRPPGSITSRGLRLEVSKWDARRKPFLLRLNCRFGDDEPVYLEICKQDDNEFGLYFRASYLPIKPTDHADEPGAQTERIPIYLAMDKKTLRHNTSVVNATWKRHSAPARRKKRKLGPGDEVPTPDRRVEKMRRINSTNSSRE